jgi:hypothetical protein
MLTVLCYHAVGSCVEEAVATAITAVGVEPLCEKHLDELRELHDLVSELRLTEWPVYIPQLPPHPALRLGD